MKTAAAAKRMPSAAPPAPSAESSSAHALLLHEHLEENVGVDAPMPAKPPAPKPTPRPVGVGVVQVLGVHARVILGLLLLVAQHLVCLRHVLEGLFRRFLLRVGRVGVPVRVMLQRRLCV